MQPRLEMCTAAGCPSQWSDVWGIAMQAMHLSKEAAQGWEAGSMQGRQTALASCKEAVECAETCHRELINVFKMNT